MTRPPPPAGALTRRHSDLPHFQSVARLSSLPLVESGITIAGNVYEKIKRSNSLMSWSLDTAEQSFAIATASAKPAMLVLNGPMTTLDHLLCKGIDIVEERVPAVHLPPQLLFLNTRDYVNDKFVKPVLKRAGSVKQMGSQAAEAAVDRLDGAISVADKYVDQYLPADPADKLQEDTNVAAEPISKTTRTIIHGAKLSRKVQKRLTRRTLAEAKALKDQSTECIHVLLYVVELVATDPKMAYKKAKELWAALSLPEPENQARPATLEQLLVLLTRESARRIVHLVNGTVAIASKAPKRFGYTLITLSHQLLSIAEVTLKMTPIIGNREKTETQISILRDAIDSFRITANLFLERTAIFLAGRPQPKKVTSQGHEQNHNNHRGNRTANGVD